MKRVAAMTVIRGEGECVALMNNVVMEEMARMNAKHKNEMAVVTAERDGARISRDALRDKDRAELLAKLEEKPSLWVRFVNAIETAWCVFFAILLEWGFIERVETHETSI